MSTRMAPQPVQVGVWKSAQALGIILTVVLIAGLVQAPELTLKILWNAVVPLLPATFLIQPEIWRNVCPLATLNMVTGERVGRRTLDADAARKFGVVGIVLLLAMVPARRFLFNTDGLVLAVTVAIVGVLALLTGLVFHMKAGFCNTLCPVLPVEKLYGQAPLMKAPNARCIPCTLCTRRGCLDLVPTKSVEQAMGASGPGRWLLTPYGIFAAAFPGFVIGYYTTTDVVLSAAASVYAHIGLWMLGSYVVVAIVAVLSRLPGSRIALGIGAVSIGLYYWFAGPAVTDALALPGWAATVIRVAALGLVVLWLTRALNGRPKPRPKPRPA